MGANPPLLDFEEAGRLSARLLRFKAGRKLDVPAVVSQLGISRASWFRLVKHQQISWEAARRLCDKLGWDFHETVRCQDYDTTDAILTPAFLQMSASGLHTGSQAGLIQVTMAAATLLYSEMVVRGIPASMTVADLARPYSTVMFVQAQVAREVSFYVDKRKLCYQLSSLKATGSPVLEGFGLANELGMRFAMEFLVRGHEAASGRGTMPKRAYARLSEAFNNLSRQPR